jgi:hypothetical protein
MLVGKGRMWDKRTLQEDDRCMDPRHGAEVHQAFTCFEHLAILRLRLADVDAFSTAVRGLDVVCVLLVRHGRYQ